MTGTRLQQATSFPSHLAGAVTKPLLIIPDTCEPFNTTEKINALYLPKVQGSEITLSIMIEAAWGLVISRAAGANDIVPVRIRTHSCQRTQELLKSLQRLQSDMMPFEHLGFQAIWKLSPETESILKNTVSVNFVPFLDAIALWSRPGHEDGVFVFEMRGSLLDHLCAKRGYPNCVDQFRRCSHLR